jgi:molybdopterin-containing oxidoreductase family iron-sulfur binding subunit
MINERSRSAKKKVSDMKRLWGMALDLDKCTDAGPASRLQPGKQYADFDDDSDIPKRVVFLDLMKVTNDRDKDAKFGDFKWRTFPKFACSARETTRKTAPPLRIGVPGRGDRRGDDRVVSQICRAASAAVTARASCPYEARVFNWWKPRHEGSFQEGLNPDVSVPSRGTVVKCTFCSHI